MCFRAAFAWNTFLWRLPRPFAPAKRPGSPETWGTCDTLKIANVLLLLPRQHGSDHPRYAADRALCQQIHTGLIAPSTLTGTPAYVKPLRHAFLEERHGGDAASLTTVTLRLA